MKKYAVIYYPNGNESKYVGSISDYQGGVVQVVCNETGDVVYEETVR